MNINFADGSTVNTRDAANAPTIADLHVGDFFSFLNGAQTNLYLFLGPIIFHLNSNRVFPVRHRSQQVVFHPAVSLNLDFDPIRDRRQMPERSPSPSQPPTFLHERAISPPDPDPLDKEDWDYMDDSF